MTEDDIFAAAKSRWNRLADQAAAVPVVALCGVVAPSGATGVKSQGDAGWTLSFDLAAWRLPQGEIRSTQLLVRRQVTDEELGRLRAAIAPYAVVRLRARIVVDESNGTTAAFLESFEGVETEDSELTAFADRLHQPVTLEDSRLGRFTLDRGVDRFMADVVWNGVRASLSLSAVAVEEARAALVTAHALWADGPEWDRRVRGLASRDLLALKNESWLEEGELALTASEFAARMEIESIWVASDGSFEFWYADGDLFWGHAIEIRGALSEGPTDATIAG